MMKYFKILFVLSALTFLLGCKKEKVNFSNGEIFYYSDVGYNSTGDTLYAVFIPSAFSPGFNAKNDIFLPKCTGIKSEGFSMEIFNLSQNLIYSTKDINQGWNGINRSGEICQVQNYIYKIVCYDLTGKKHIYESQFMLLR